MQVIKLEEERYSEAIRLSEYAFQYKVPEDQIEKRIEKMKKHHQLYGVIIDNELAAKLHLLPFEIYLGNKKWKMGGIAGVATYPEYRRRGLVKDLLVDVLAKMREEGYSISMLHPFSVSFYRKYGWELLTNKLKSTLFKLDLIMDQPTDGYIKRFNQGQHHDDMAAIYDQYARRYSGMLVREREWWENVYSDMSGALYYNQAKQPRGYMLYTIKDSKMEVEEFVALDGEARRGLWNYICQHDSMIKQLEIITHEREPLFFSLKEPQVKAEISPYFMVRIVDVEPFLQDYDFNWSHSSEEGVILSISDPHAPWNNRSFSLKDRSISTIAESNEIQENQTLTLSINALSTILFGYKRPVELYQVGHIKGKEEAIHQLERLVPHQQTYFYDFF